MMTADQQRQPQTHVRPKVRSSRKVAATKEKEQEDLDALLEQTRQQVDSWLKVTVSDAAGASRNKVAATRTSNADQQSTAGATPSSTKSDSNRKQQPRGILRKPKYSSSKDAVDYSSSRAGNEEPTGSKSRNHEKPQLPFVKDIVVERDISKIQQQAPVPSMVSSAASIEGYTPNPNTSTQRQAQQSNVAAEEEAAKEDPSQTINENTEQDEEPLVLSSMEQLLAHSRNSDTGGNGNDPQILEADLEFQCMAPQDYESKLSQVFLGKKDIFGDDNNGDENDETMSVDEPNDDALLYELERLMENDDNYEEEYHVDTASDSDLPPEPRAFMRLWTALSDWITPEAVQMVNGWRQGEYPVQQQQQPTRNDVEASRCAGLHSILRMHLGAVDFAQEQRRVESKLASLLNTFDYSQHNPKLGTKLWRCMAAVLVNIVTCKEEILLPKCAQEVGMTLEEFQYLCQSALTSLGQKVEP